MAFGFDVSLEIGEEKGKEIKRINSVHAMCIESLPPEIYSKWEDVCKMLFENRKALKGLPLPWELK